MCCVYCNRIHFLIVTNSCDRWHKINSSIIGLHAFPYLYIVNKSDRVCFVTINRLVEEMNIMLSLSILLNPCLSLLNTLCTYELRDQDAIDIVCDNKHMLLVHFLAISVNIVIDAFQCFKVHFQMTFYLLLVSIYIILTTFS